MILKKSRVAVMLKEADGSESLFFYDFAGFHTIRVWIQWRGSNQNGSINAFHDGDLFPAVP